MLRLFQKCSRPGYQNNHYDGINKSARIYSYPVCYISDDNNCIIQTHTTTYLWDVIFRISRPSLPYTISNPIASPRPIPASCGSTSNACRIHHCLLKHANMQPGIPTIQRSMRANNEVRRSNCVLGIRKCTFVLRCIYTCQNTAQRRSTPFPHYDSYVHKSACDS